MTDRIVIITNLARCRGCGQEIESKSRHDFVTCACGKLSVDGGREYLKRNYHTTVGYDELSKTEKTNGSTTR